MALFGGGNIDAAVKRTVGPVVSSDLATFWVALRAAGVDEVARASAGCRKRTGYELHRPGRFGPLRAYTLRHGVCTATRAIVHRGLGGPSTDAEPETTFRQLAGPRAEVVRSRMLSIRDIDHVVLRVCDIEAMTRFYCDILGAEYIAYRPEFGMTHLRAGASMIDLVAVDGPLGKKGGTAPGKEGRNMDHLCLRIEPFDQDRIVAHLKAHGVAVGEIRLRFGAEGNGISIYLADPEGNTVELKGPSDAKPPPQPTP